MQGAVFSLVTLKLNNQLSEVRVYSYNQIIRDSRTMTNDFNLSPSPLKHPALAYHENIIAVSKKYFIGNCFELAANALDYIIEHEDEVKGLNGELYSIKGGDHGFLVINRDPLSDPHNPDTWGNAVICDPWSDNVYPARHYRMILKTHYPEHGKHYIKNFDPHRNYLAPSLYNTNLLLEMRKPENIKSRFFEYITEIMTILINYKLGLEKEKDRLITTYGLNDKKASLINKKMIDVEGFILATNQTIELIKDKKYDDYHQAIFDLEQTRSKIHKDAIHTMTFDKIDVGSLSEHKGEDFATDVMKFFNIKSKTQNNLIKITETVNNNLKKLK